MSLDSHIREGLEDATRRVSPSVEDALGAVLHRSDRTRLRRRIGAGAAVVAVIIGGLVAVGVLRAQDNGSSVAVRTDGRQRTSGWVRLRNDEAAVSVSIPPAWREVARRPAATPPEVLTYGSADRVADGPIGVCDTTPKDGVLVAVHELPAGAVSSVWGDPSVVRGPIGPRPADFATATPRLTGTSQCMVSAADPAANLDLAPEMTAVFYVFAEQDRNLLAVIASASDVPAEQVALAKQTLNTLEVAEQPDPATSSPPTSTAPPPSTGQPQTGATERLQGTYRGNERYSMYTGRCAYLAHDLQARFEVENRGSWQYQAKYCGTVDGDLWTGEGTFTLTDPDGATLTGTFASSARLPSSGEPYELTVTGGAKRFEGATGSCALDNHLNQTGPGRQEQYGSFVCDITT
jgi:hypothetical protein